MTLALFAALSASWAAPGTEFVIVLDNSCSMVEEHSREGEPKAPAADPERRAVLGALLVAGLAADTQDRVTVLGFPRDPGGPRFESSDPAAIREIPISTGTFFREPLIRASDLLRGSDRENRLLLFLSDGDPNDLEDPAEGRALLGLDDAQVPFDTLVLGLFPGENERAETFLRPLAVGPKDYVRVHDGADLVSDFTRAYARVLGSRAIAGELTAGGRTSFEVGRYVTEVLAVATNIDPNGPFTPVLKRDERSFVPDTTGDNGCSAGTRRNPDLCKPPRLHYATWRIPHDPKQTSRWSLSLERNGPIAYGVILRYDIDARIEVPNRAETGKPVRIRGILTWDGNPFVDQEFFKKDGFAAEATVDGQTIPLKHLGKGVFEAEWTPTRVGRNDVVVHFSNTWMEKRDRARIRVAPDKPLALTTTVDTLDFGSWSGERRSTQRCLDLTVDSNRPIGSDTLAYRFEGVPRGLTLTVLPTDGGAQACARAKGCCGAIDTAGTFMLVTASTDGEQATLRIPVRAIVAPTGFLTCWWPTLLGLLLLLLLLLFLYGWIRPHDFDEDLTVRIAGSERQLGRSAALVLREQSGGRRGFYRNARIALTGSGDFIRRPKSAAVWIEAVGSGETKIHQNTTVEVQDRRTRKWVPLTEEQAQDGVRPHTLYRVGDILFRFQ